MKLLPQRSIVAMSILSFASLLNPGEAVGSSRDFDALVAFADQLLNGKRPIGSRPANPLLEACYRLLVEAEPAVQHKVVPVMLKAILETPESTSADIEAVARALTAAAETGQYVQGGFEMFKQVLRRPGTTSTTIDLVAEAVAANAGRHSDYTAPQVVELVQLILDLRSSPKSVEWLAKALHEVVLKDDEVSLGLRPTIVEMLQTILGSAAKGKSDPLLATIEHSVAQMLPFNGDAEILAAIADKASIQSDVFKSLVSRAIEATVNPQDSTRALRSVYDTLLEREDTAMRVAELSAEALEARAQQPDASAEMVYDSLKRILSLRNSPTTLISATRAIDGFHQRLVSHEPKLPGEEVENAKARMVDFLKEIAADAKKDGDEKVVGTLISTLRAMLPFRGDLELLVSVAKDPHATTLNFIEIAKTTSSLVDSTHAELPALLQTIRSRSPHAIAEVLGLRAGISQAEGIHAVMNAKPDFMKRYIAVLETPASEIEVLADRLQQAEASRFPVNSSYDFFNAIMERPDLSPRMAELVGQGVLAAAERSQSGYSPRQIYILLRRGLKSPKVNSKLLGLTIKSVEALYKRIAGAEPNPTKHSTEFTKEKGMMGIVLKEAIEKNKPATEAMLRSAFMFARNAGAFAGDMGILEAVVNHPASTQQLWHDVAQYIHSPTVDINRPGLDSVLKAITAKSPTLIKEMLRAAARAQGVDTLDELD